MGETRRALHECVTGRRSDWTKGGFPSSYDAEHFHLPRQDFNFFVPFGAPLMISNGKPGSHTKTFGIDPLLVLVCDLGRYFYQTIERNCAGLLICLRHCYFEKRVYKYYNY